MKLRLQAVLLALASVAHSQEKTDLKLSGTAINTTNPDKPLAAPIEITLDSGSTGAAGGSGARVLPVRPAVGDRRRHDGPRARHVCGAIALGCMLGCSDPLSCTCIPAG